jgi:nucleoside-diphosphate-sugar epimerase
LQQAGILQNGRGGANRSDPFRRAIMRSHDLLDAWVRAQLLHARTSRQKDAIEDLAVKRADRGVGMKGNSASPGDVHCLAERCGRDFGARSAEQVHRGDRFNFLKSFREDCENRRHAMTSTAMGAAPHGYFSGRRLAIFGAGYIGTAVAAFASAQGASVSAVTRNHEAVDALRRKGVDAVVGDLTSPSWHGAVGGAPDFALYCAAGGGAGESGYLHSYLNGMKGVLAWLADRGGAGTFIYTSSTAVYPQDGGLIVDEAADTVAPGNDRCGVLAATEHLVLASRNAFGRAFVLRLSGIYGPQRHALLDEIRSGIVSGSPNQRLNLVHRDDIVAAMAQCLSALPSHGGGVYNVSDGRPTTRGEVAAWVAQQLQIKAPSFTRIPRSTRRATPLDRIIDASKLRRELGWQPRFPSFREGYAPLLAEARIAAP